MRKLSTLLSLALMLLLVASCSKSGRDIKTLLNYVPEDSWIVMTGDAEEILDHFDVKLTKDGITYSDKLEKLIKDYDGDKEELKKALTLISYTDNVFVFFLKDQQSYLCAPLDDTEKFVKMLEDEFDIEFEQKGDALVCTSRDQMAVYNDALWFYTGDLHKVKAFYDLSDKDSFAGAHPELVSKLELGGEKVFAAVSNITSLFDTMRDEIGMMQTSMAQMFIGTLFEDPKYGYMQIKVDDNAIKSKSVVLNAKCQPAKFLLPVGKLTKDDLQLAGQDAPITFALDVPSGFMKKLLTPFKSMAGAMSSADSMIFESLESIKGLVASSVEPDNGGNPGSIWFTIGFDDAQKASNVAAFIRSNGNPAEVEGKSVVSGKPQSSAKVDKDLVGKFAFVNIDLSSFSNKFSNRLSDPGCITIVLEKEDKGLELETTYKAKDALFSLLEVFMSSK